MSVACLHVNTPSFRAVWVQAFTSSYRVCVCVTQSNGSCILHWYTEICLSTHRVLVGPRYWTASTCPGSLQAHAKRRSRCFSLFVCPPVCLILLEEKPNAKHPDKYSCVSQMDQMTMGNSFCTVHNMSTVISVQWGISYHSNSPNIPALIFQIHCGYVCTSVSN